MDFILSIYYFSLGAFIGSIPIAMLMLCINDYRTLKILSLFGVPNFMVVVIGFLNN